MSYAMPVASDAWGGPRRQTPMPHTHTHTSSLSHTHTHKPGAGHEDRHPCQAPPSSRHTSSSQTRRFVGLLPAAAIRTKFCLALVLRGRWLHVEGRGREREGEGGRERERSRGRGREECVQSGEYLCVPVFRRDTDTGQSLKNRHTYRNRHRRRHRHRHRNIYRHRHRHRDLGRRQEDGARERLVARRFCVSCVKPIEQSARAREWASERARERER